MLALIMEKAFVAVAFMTLLNNEVQLVSSLKEFSLARFSDITVYANNSFIGINLVGEGSTTEGGALECHTDDTTCCTGAYNPNGPGRGEWYYPDGTVVPPPGVSTGFYRTRDHKVIRLNRIDGDVRALSLTGEYRCVIPGAGGVNITRYVTLVRQGDQCSDLSLTKGSYVTYTPPRGVFGNGFHPQRGRQFTGTIATYSCSSGYTLIGESSLRACGPGGTWNGTESSCDINSPLNSCSSDISNIIGGVVAAVWFLVSMVIIVLLIVYNISLKRRLTNHIAKDRQYVKMVQYENVDGAPAAEYREMDKTKKKTSKKPRESRGDYKLINCPAYGQVDGRVS